MLLRSTQDMILALRATSPRRPCVHRCGRPARHGFQTCYRCAAYHKQANADWRAQRKAAGVCVRCPDPAVVGKSLCRPCLDRHAADARRRYRRRAGLD